MRNTNASIIAYIIFKCYLVRVSYTCTGAHDAIAELWKHKKGHGAFDDRNPTVRCMCIYVLDYPDFQCFWCARSI